MTQCNRCETLPNTQYQHGTLYLSPPMVPTFTTIEGILERHSIDVYTTDARILAIPFSPGMSHQLCTEFPQHLSEMELADTKCLFLPEEEDLSISHLASVQNLEEFLSLSDNQWFIDLLRDERLESWFQPIVKCSQPERVFAYECLIRGKRCDGTTIFPPELFGTARSADMLFYLDRLCRQTAITDAAKHRISDNLFINFNPTSIYDPKHCLKTTLETIRKLGFPSEKIVFEVVETDQVEDINHLLTIIRFYRDQGFRIALDDLGAGYASLNLLHQLKPNFIKIDMELIQRVDKDSYKSIIVRNLLALANSLNIDSIAEGVERTEEWQWLMQHGATYIQGYLFAKPSAVPPVPRVP